MVEADKPRRTQAERRMRVLDSAEFLFKEKGFHDCGVAAIAERAGVHVAQIYRDFPGKEGLIEALVRQGLGRVIEDMGAALRKADLREGVRQWLQETIAAAREPGPGRLISEIFAEASRNPAVGQIIAQREAEARRTLIGVLDEHFAGSRTEGSVEAIAELLMMLNFSFYTRLAAAPLADFSGLAVVVERALMAVLCPSAPDGSCAL